MEGARQRGPPMALAGRVECYRQALSVNFGIDKLLLIIIIFPEDAFWSNLGK